MWPKPKTFAFFLYKVRHGETYDERCPCGGIVVRAWTETAMVAKAYAEAHRRFPGKPGEILVVDRVHDQVRCRQAMLMERDWDREFQKFEQLMTVG